MPTLERPTVLLKSCATCRHLSVEYCTLPKSERTIYGRILIAQAVVCVKHEPQERG